MDPFGHISSGHRARKNGARIGMNVAAHQEKETKKGKRKAGEKKKQTTDFKEVVCCPSAVVQGGSIAKK